MCCVLSTAGVLWCDRRWARRTITLASCSRYDTVDIVFLYSCIKSYITLKDMGQSRQAEALHAFAMAAKVQPQSMDAHSHLVSLNNEFIEFQKHMKGGKMKQG